MGRLWDVAGSLKTLVESAVSSDGEVVVRFAPEEALPMLQHPRFVAIWPASSTYGGPLTFGTGAGNITQEGEWEWDLFVGSGVAGDYGKALEIVDGVVALLDTNLIGTEPTGSGPLYYVTHHTPLMATETSIVFRVTIAHYRLDE